MDEQERQRYWQRCREHLLAATVAIRAAQSSLDDADTYASRVGVINVPAMQEHLDAVRTMIAEAYAEAQEGSSAQ